MIDAIWVPTSVHFAVGTLVVATSAAAVAISVAQGVRNRPVGRFVHAAFVLTQVTLAVQALIGIKLLDQGLGPLQLYIHYVGGLGPLLFFLLYYWFPARFRAWRWAASSVSIAAFFFAISAYYIGQVYDPAAHGRAPAALEIVARADGQERVWSA